MSIGKVVRTISEKTTSVQDDIEVSQKGIISFVPAAATGLVFGIPTTIQNPVMLHLLPMNADTAGALGGNSSGSACPWYCDLTLHHASGVSRAFASLASISYVEDIGRRIRISATDLSLYVAQASMAANYASNTVVIASSSLWKLDERFASNAKKYLMVTISKYASATNFHVKKQVLAFEVRGYNYD